MTEIMFICTGVLLFLIVRPEVIAERGNNAIGGEVFLIIMPLLLYTAVLQVIHGVREAYNMTEDNEGEAESDSV